MALVNTKISQYSISCGNMAIIWNKINGMVETGKALKGLTEPKFRKAALRKAGKVSMSPVLSAVKSAAPAFTNLSNQK